MIRELIVATRNQGKLKEIRQLLEKLPIEVVSLADLPDIPDVLEDGATFADNARKKAETIARLTGKACLADDSGLTVDILQGAPGVHSARFAGENATDADNNRELLKVLGQVPERERTAAFCCVMALCLPGEDSRFFYGRVEGRILSEARGDGGFGYDPLFLVREFGKTMAELPLATKNRISHRGQALVQVVQYLQDSGSPSSD